MQLFILTFILFCLDNGERFISSYGADKIKLATKERGYDWEKMSEEEREEFIDLVVHEK